MPVSPLRPLLAPASVAIVGSSNKSGSLGRDAVEMIVCGAESIDFDALIATILSFTRLCRAAKKQGSDPSFH
jgi:hypothetical protein